MNLNSIKYKKGVAIFIFLLLIQTVNAQTTSYKYVSDETQFDFVITGVSGTYFDFLSVDDDVTLRYEESLKGKVSEDILEVRVSYSLNGDGVNDEVEWAKLTLVMALWAVAPVDGGGTNLFDDDSNFIVDGDEATYKTTDVTAVYEYETGEIISFSFRLTGSSDSIAYERKKGLLNTNSVLFIFAIFALPIVRRFKK